jgi:N-acetyl-anhydromuramyl-L-alanine amidase AmpD
VLNIKLRNLHVKWDAIAEARLYVDPLGQVYPDVGNRINPFEVTNSGGAASLDLSLLTPGRHALWIVPKHTSADRVGPDTGERVQADRIYRGLCVDFNVSEQKNLTTAYVFGTPSSNGKVLSTSLGSKNQSLEIGLHPVWVKSPYNVERGKPLDMIIVHKTGGTGLGSPINQFLFGGTSAHYIIDRDGQVVKMVRDSRAAGHASNENNSDQSHWGTQTRLAYRSIGIENVGTVGQGLEDVQYDVLIGLIEELMRVHGIKRHRVLAHSDILTDGSGALSDLRIACPGHQFQWSKLEQKNIGLARFTGSGGDDPVGPFFTMANVVRGMTLGQPLVLREGDRDAKMAAGKLRPGRFGGREMPDVDLQPIKHLQRWLAEIGYSVGPQDGVYTKRMARAVFHFQTHFIGGGANQFIDQQTAELIRGVALANPKAD